MTTKEVRVLVEQYRRGTAKEREGILKFLLDNQEATDAFAFVAGLDPKCFAVFCRLACTQKRPKRKFKRCLVSLAKLWRQAEKDKKLQEDIVNLVWKLGRYPAITKFSLTVNWPTRIFLNKLNVA